MNRRSFVLAMAGVAAMRAGAARAMDFAPVRPGRPLVFPADYGAHPSFRTEWWYATGALALPDHSPLGFQITFFRVRTGIGETSPSAFAPTQLIFAHAAIADPRFGRLRHDERAARVGFGRAGFDVGKAHVWIRDWRLQQDGDRYVAEAAGRDFAYSLALVASAPPVLNGDAGFSMKAPDPRNASYYYSQPQLAVSGTVTLSGERHAVSGSAWLDHEWSSEYMPAGARGWDWVGLNLDDGGSVMAFRMRSEGGAALWASATVKSAQGHVTTFSRDEVAFEPGRRWQSPRTAIAYPVEWALRIGGQVLQLRPLIDDQEMDSSRTTGAIYWEGAVRVMAGERQIGRGYLELTGYGETIRVG